MFMFGLEVREQNVYFIHHSLISTHGATLGGEFYAWRRLLAKSFFNILPVPRTPFFRVFF